MSRWELIAIRGHSREARTLATFEFFDVPAEQAVNRQFVSDVNSKADMSY